MMIVKFHKLPMKISEETLFFNFTRSAMYCITHTHTVASCYSVIYSPTNVYLAKRALAVVNRINS